MKMLIHIYFFLVVKNWAADMDSQTEKVTNNNGTTKIDIVTIPITVYVCQVQASPKVKNQLQVPSQKSAVEIRLTTGMARKSRMLNTRKVVLMILNFWLMEIVYRDLLFNLFQAARFRTSLATNASTQPPCFSFFEDVFSTRKMPRLI